MGTGKNLQICFVNDAAAAADGDSLSSDSESCPKLSKPITHTNQSTSSLNRLSGTAAQPNPYSSRPLSMKKMTPKEKGSCYCILFALDWNTAKIEKFNIIVEKILTSSISEVFLYFLSGISSAVTLDASKTVDDPQEIDFFTKQARLQIEARMALAQAKDIAHMQMEVNT